MGTDKANPIPGTIWLTGICASGKTTLGRRLYENLVGMGMTGVDFVDGEDVRKHIGDKYGHSMEDRFALLEELVDIVKLSNEEGNVVIVCTVSHKKEMRERARAKIPSFMEVFASCSPESCARRDYKGHYRRARAGEYKTFPGVTEPYEVSESPELVLNTEDLTVGECSDILLRRTLAFLKFERRSCNLTA